MTDVDRTNVNEDVKSASDIAMINQHILRRLIDREVVQNVSMLVSHFQQNPEALDGSDYDYDELLSLCERRDYLEAALNHVDDMDRGDVIDALNATFEDADEDASTAELRVALRTALNDADLDLVREFCDDQGVDPEICEVLEHWVVSEWFAEKLAEKGEATGELFGLTIWGRTCSGQAILLDGVVEGIAKDMEILHGMANEWK